MSDGLNDDDYMAGLIRSAHGEVATAFDVAAAATAQTGRLSHMYEFGVPGITAGPPKILDPTSAAARLWEHTLIGRGGSQDIGYTIRPATIPNPQPTVESTGVASKYLAKLSRRKYVFYNKAFVIETGQTVTIRPKNGRFLFVPFYGHPSRYDVENTRGYMMSRGPIVMQPGAANRGAFTSTWMSWWGSAGAELMENKMRATITKDIALAQARAGTAANSARMKSVTLTNIAAAAGRGYTKGKKAFGATTKAVKGIRRR
jgi:hypothetical protein